MGPNGSWSSCEGEPFGEVTVDVSWGGVVAGACGLPKLTTLVELDLLAGEANLDRVFRNADLRFGGAGSAVIGSFGSFTPGCESRSLSSSSMTSKAVLVSVRLWVEAEKA